MPERPDDISNDRYGWLYSDKGDGQLPPPELPPTTGGGAKASDPFAKPRKKRRWILLLILALLLAWLAFFVGVPFWAWGQVSRVNAEPKYHRPADQPGTNYLIVGSDSRRGLTWTQRRKLATGPDLGSARTDTIMLMHVGSGPTLLMSIPRDSLVEVPGAGTTKINAAYAFGGPRLLVQTIEQNTGLRVDDYVEVGFGGLVNVVDAVGGIKICPKTNITDPDAALKLKAGCQWVDGNTALGYSRSRHTYLTQDIQRVQSQREVIASIAHEVKSASTFLNPFRYYRVTTGGASSLQVGDNMSLPAMVRFVSALTGVMGKNGLNCTVPLHDFAVTWDSVRAPQMFSKIKYDRTDKIGKLCTKDGLPPR